MNWPHAPRAPDPVPWARPGLGRAPRSFLSGPKLPGLRIRCPWGPGVRGPGARGRPGPGGELRSPGPETLGTVPRAGQRGRGPGPGARRNLAPGSGPPASDVPTKKSREMALDAHFLNIPTPRRHLKIWSRPSLADALAKTSRQNALAANGLSQPSRAQQLDLVTGSPPRCCGKGCCILFRNRPEVEV